MGDKKHRKCISLQKQHENFMVAVRNVFIMGYVTFSLGRFMVCCSVASLAVGYIYLSCSHLYSFASYDRPYALKIKYPVTRGFS